MSHLSHALQGGLCMYERVKRERERDIERER